MTIVELSYFGYYIKNWIWENFMNCNNNNKTTDILGVTQKTHSLQSFDDDFLGKIICLVCTFAPVWTCFVLVVVIATVYLLRLNYVQLVFYSINISVMLHFYWYPRCFVQNFSYYFPFVIWKVGFFTHTKIRFESFPLLNISVTSIVVHRNEKRREEEE